MKGEVLHYDDNIGTGHISGADGNRYHFSRGDLRQLVPVGRGTKVDFDFEGKQASDIYIDDPSERSKVPEGSVPNSNFTNLVGSDRVANLRPTAGAATLHVRKTWAVRLLWLYFAVSVVSAVLSTLSGSFLAAFHQALARWPKRTRMI